MKPNSSIQLFPLLRIACSLIAGIALGHCFVLSGFGVSGLLPLFIGLVAVGMALFRYPMVQSTLIMLATCCLGMLLTVRAEARLQAHLTDEEVVYKAVLTSEPEERGRVVRFDMIVTTGQLEGWRIKASILRDTVDCLYKRLHVGDGILAASVLEEPHDFTRSNFHYPIYLQSHGFTCTTLIFGGHWRKAVVALSHLSRLDRVKIRAMKVRLHLLERCRGLGIGGQSLAVIAAMTLGDKSQLDEQTRNAYSVSGASHVLALSGLHIGIIYMLLTFLTLSHRRRLLREVSIVAAIWAYVIMVGMPSSVVRAAVMITVYSMVSLIQYDRMSLNTLSLTAIVMLLANPLSLFDVGFQMSFLSVLFILILYRPLYRLVHPYFLFRHRSFAWVWSMLAVSLSAQMGAAPLVAYYFGRFPCLFLLSNFIVIPVATAIFYLAFLLFVLEFWPVAQRWVAELMAWLVELQNGTLQKISSMPFASMEDIHINRAQLVVLYLIIALVTAAILRYSSSLARKRYV